MLTLDQIPSYDTPPEGPGLPRTVAAELGNVTTARRSFLRVVGAGGTALGLTMLGWLPPARVSKARATVGSEYMNCNIYGYSDSILCWPHPYGSYYCGSDKWFKNGCWRNPADGLTDCFYPRTWCNSRNAWRWTKRAADGHYDTYRCADGVVYWGHTGSPSERICSAYLYSF